ncbi:MAG: Rieske 2Fe-2S domain-containing protein [Candidatus Microthrix sp.]|nr:Rieske 2Fe-2S domain-containing protein [Candidatus Microthrix sp.]
MREPSSPAPSTATLPGEAAPPTRGEPEGDVVANVEDLEVGSTRMVRVDGRRLCLARTIEGVFAIDNACPHEGYGLTQGELVGDVLTPVAGTTGSSGSPTVSAFRARSR